MTPRTITDNDLEYWGALDPYRRTYTGPGEIESGIEPCPAIELNNGEIAVAWTLDEIELVHLAQGGTLWLSTFGGLPIHGLHVQVPE
jgi:hypothetical protein